MSCSNNHFTNKKIIVQPYDDMPKALNQKIVAQLQEIFPEVSLQASIPLPTTAYYAPRNRYRADSLIRILRRSINKNEVIIGLTTKDISTTKGANKDWGVMGLAYTPGNACVVSSYRLHRDKLYHQFYKVCVHELGHTAGLPHCPEKTCFMRDAEGGNPIDEETAFCKKCTQYLIRKGWNLNSVRP
jgi:archaemetzincin